VRYVMHLLVTLVLGTFLFSQENPTGSIRGRVVDGNTGLAIENVEVVVIGQATGASGLEVNALTDKEGNFFLTQVPAGTVGIAASKEAAGYPNLLYGLYGVGSGKIPQVEVRRAETTTGVIVRITKGGILVGRVQDDLTGKPIGGAQLRLSRRDNDSLFLVTRADLKGEFQFVLPSLNYELRVSETGYKTWESRMSGGSNQKGFFLVPGERREIVVPLEK
jgi:hypothetical protein